MNTVTVYTDGACSPNPGIGAWAYQVEWPDGTIEARAAPTLKGTNNREELKAVREALLAVRARIGDSPEWRIVIYTDSLDVKNWLEKSSKRKANLDLYPTIDWLVDDRVHIEPVRGHSGNAGNERVNDLAVKARKQLRRLADGKET